MAAGSGAESGFTRRQVLRASALTLGAGALAACGSGSGSGGSKTGKVHLTNVEHDDRPLDDAAYRAVYNAFQKKYPDISMTFQIIPWETSEQKMLTLGQGNGLPNVGRMAYPSDYAARPAWSSRSTTWPVRPTKPDTPSRRWRPTRPRGRMAKCTCTACRGSPVPCR